MSDSLLTTVEFALVFRLFVAMGVGALIGMEREHSASGGHFAGARTFPLVALFGALTQEFFPAVFPVALGLLALLVAVGYVSKVMMESDIGMTTAIATVLTFFYGAMAIHSDKGLVLAIVLGTLTTAVLTGKEHVQWFATRIEPEERYATVKFLIVALVVLPLLPNHPVPWLFDLNPQFVWLMVVFVSGLEFGGYILSKFINTHHGIGLSGLLGGFVSSTATAVAMANRASRNRELSEICAFATIIATIAMLPRALIEVAVIYPALAPTVAVPIITMSLVGVLFSLALFWRVRSADLAETDLTNPFRLRPALSFGAVFAVILVVSEKASTAFGAWGIYATALLAGLADVDSITISLSKLALEGDIPPSVATTGIVLAAIANTIVKVGITWFFGTRRLGMTVTVVLGVTGLFGLGVLLLI